MKKSAQEMKDIHMKEVLDTALKQLKEILEQDRAARINDIGGYIYSTVGELTEGVVWSTTGPEEEFAKARKTMGTHLREDEDMYFGYQSNIAMAIYDITMLRKESCNDLAKRLIKVVFDIDDPDDDPDECLEESTETKPSRSTARVAEGCR